MECRAMVNYLDKTIVSFQKHYQVGFAMDVNTAIEGISLEHLKNSRVVFQKEVWERIQNIALTTQIDTKEVGFLLYGKEFLPNQVYLNKLVLSDAPLKSIETEFGKLATEDFLMRIDENLDERTVVVYGHSHPKITEKYQYFSLQDLANLYELTEEITDFQTKNMQLIGCLVTPDVPVQFIYYNPADEKFYDFERIEIEGENYGRF